MKRARLISGASLVLAGLLGQQNLQEVSAVATFGQRAKRINGSSYAMNLEPGVQMGQETGLRPTASSAGIDLNNQGAKPTEVQEPNEELDKTGKDELNPEGDQNKAGKDEERTLDQEKDGSDAVKPADDQDKDGKDAEKSEGDQDKDGKDQEKTLDDQEKPGKDGVKPGGEQDKDENDAEKSEGDQDKDGKDQEKTLDDQQNPGKDGVKPAGDQDKDEEQISDDQDKPQDTENDVSGDRNNKIGDKVDNEDGKGDAKDAERDDGSNPGADSPRNPLQLQVALNHACAVSTGGKAKFMRNTEDGPRCFKNITVGTGSCYDNCGRVVQCNGKAGREATTGGDVANSLTEKLEKYRLDFCGEL